MVAVREPGAQGVPGGHVARPVEHLLPVGHVGVGRRLDQQAGVAGLAVGAGRDELRLGLGREREELLEQGVRLVDQIGADVVGDVDEAGRERPHQPVHHGPLRFGAALLEREEVDLEDLVCHGGHGSGDVRRQPGERRVAGDPAGCRDLGPGGYRRRPMAVVLGLLVALAYGSGDFFGGLAAKRSPATTVVIGSFGLSAVLLAVTTVGWAVVGTLPDPDRVRPVDRRRGGPDRPGGGRPALPRPGHRPDERGRPDHRRGRRRSCRWCGASPTASARRRSPWWAWPSPWLRSC